MKLSPILIATAVAFGGTAMAQSRDYDKRSSGTERSASARQADEKPGVVDKTKRGAQRAAEATKSGAKKAATATGNVARKGADTVRNTGEAIARKLPPAPGSAQAQRPPGPDAGGTMAMGAGPAGSARSAGTTTASASDDGDRRQRMDDAYANWRRQQGQR
ncbi:hypothetical protein EZ313_10800 [Ramlibacter henchirensis]|uniref:Cell envelope biogenesis protein TolA n=1 Tax=Ramlibacter henchirensis TaxID=204072 RepID=A0A4Z0C5Y5_9BURK|nr:hypothetical protein [Ramlibacter henchirensis]TFZ07076.1 hypothetical protein EZ313_10800 [Ramlibacter henchirensis]